MSDPVLSGLVSREAQELYSKLRAHGALRVGRGPDEVDASCPAVVELLDTGVAFRSGDGDALIRPVSPPTALQLLLKEHHARIGDLQSRALAGWERLTALLPTPVSGAAQLGSTGLELITDVPNVARLAAELYLAARHRLRGTETGEFPNRITERRAFTPSPRPNRARYQMIYQTSYAENRIGSAIIARSAAAGEEVRLRRTVLVKMLHVDDAVALVATDRAANNAVLVRAPELVAMLAEWFDLVWSDPATLLIDASEQPELTPEQLHILRLMYGGFSDEAIAKRLNTSLSTVRRKIRALCAELGVKGRFAAGTAAAKRGWL